MTSGHLRETKYQRLTEVNTLLTGGYQVQNVPGIIVANKKPYRFASKYWDNFEIKDGKVIFRMPGSGSVQTG